MDKERASLNPRTLRLPSPLEVPVENLCAKVGQRLSLKLHFNTCPSINPGLRFKFVDPRDYARQRAGHCLSHTVRSGHGKFGQTGGCATRQKLLRNFLDSDSARRIPGLPEFPKHDPLLRTVCDRQCPSIRQGSDSIIRISIFRVSGTVEIRLVCHPGGQSGRA